MPVNNTSGDPISLARKPKTKSTALGQVFTPMAIARRMLEGLAVNMAPADASLLDPCVGPATFPTALVSLGFSHVQMHTYDVDREMIETTRVWAAKNDVRVNAETRDYLDVFSESRFDFAVLNPPYIRQEWIRNKENYRAFFRERYGIDVPGTSNLYVYFVVKALADLKDGGRMACILYDSWQSTRFGKWLQDRLESSCRSLIVESVPNLPFEGRLIDATIIFAEKGSRSGRNKVSVQKINFTDKINGMNQIDNLFTTKRGLRLKQADFFMTDLGGIEQDGALPFVKKCNLIPGLIVPDDHPEAVLLLTPSRRDERTVSALRRRLAEAFRDPDDNISILTWWRERSDSWAHHSREPWAPLLFNYFIRRRPRHIYNPERIFSDNFYGLTPIKSDVSITAWFAALNSTLSVIGLLERARNQGAGLAKLQLFEYRDARVVDLEQWSGRDLSKMADLGRKLMSGRDSSEIVHSIDELILDVLGLPEIRHAELAQVLSEVDTKARMPKKMSLI